MQIDTTDARIHEQKDVKWYKIVLCTSNKHCNLTFGILALAPVLSEVRKAAHTYGNLGTGAIYRHS